MINGIDLEPLKKILEEITPEPWFYNSYSMVQVGGDMVDKWENGPDYPSVRRPGPPFFDDADNAWLAQHKAAYELDLEVCSVPADYGDTATGRHRADAIFIEMAREAIPKMIAELEVWRNTYGQQ